MNIQQVKNIIRQGEGISIEFKESSVKLNKDVYDTICSFLNRNGGHIFLGVKDNGKILGLNSETVGKIKTDLITGLNNPQKINPTIYLMPQEHRIDDKIIISLYVPESSQVHRCSGKIYDRNQDGDYDITNNTDLVGNMYQRKQSTFSENEIYPYVKLSHLRADLIQRARMLAVNNRPGHPWDDLDNLQLLKSARLYKEDYLTGKEGFTLASVLLFAQDEVLLSILPYHKTDAIVRKYNLERYDDRDDIRTNLIESYDRLMAFQAKHLSDKFYLEGDLRVSIRDKIFREIISNILIHREYKNAFPAKFIIEKEQVRTENSNRPHGFGLIDPQSFTPFPKNPVIAQFFKEIGRADELGSGVRNLLRYSKAYSGQEAKFIEEDVFKTIVPIDDSFQVSFSPNQTETTQISSQKSSQKTAQKILELIKENPNITTEEMVNKTGITRRGVEYQIDKLKRNGVLKRQGAKKTGYWEIINNVE